MNRIDQLFENKRTGILSVYMTAGFPELDDTIDIVQTLQLSGVDMIEIGMPFSDPLADGPVIQESSQKAIKNGMTINLLFKQLEIIRSSVDIPLILMGYLNPVLQFGFDRFVIKCKEVGIDGLIIPDLPLTIYKNDFRRKVENAGLHFIMLITPQTSIDRIKEISESSGGFLYMVADSTTTGGRKKINNLQISYFKKVEALKLDKPGLIGFGIYDNETFNIACKYANGAIIGSAFINKLKEGNESSVKEKSANFVKSILQ